MYYIKNTEKIRCGLKAGDHLSIEIVQNESVWIVLMCFFTQGNIELFSEGCPYADDHKQYHGDFICSDSANTYINNYIHNLADLVGVNVEIKNVFSNSQKKVYQVFLREISGERDLSLYKYV